MRGFAVTFGVLCMVIGLIIMLASDAPSWVNGLAVWIMGLTLLTKIWDLR